MLDHYEPPDVCAGNKLKPSARTGGLLAAESSSWPLPLLRQVLTKRPGCPQTRSPPTSASQAVGVTGRFTCLLDFSYSKSGFPISMTIVDKKEMVPPPFFYILF